MTHNALAIDLDDWFSRAADPGERLVVTDALVRRRYQDGDTLEIIRDDFNTLAARCCFGRYRPAQAGALSLSLNGAYRVDACRGGGWLLTPAVADRPTYWIPRAPVSRRLDGDGHLLAEEAAEIVALQATPECLALTLHAQPGHTLDWVIWRFAADAAAELATSLERLNTLETQAYFVYGSHTAYTRPADVYTHLVHGSVYSRHWSFPRRWRICDELDAFSLYMILSGLEHATRKVLYTLFKAQLVVSIIARQRADGGWYHGEWTTTMESHLRLHAGGVYLLAAALEETPRDATVRGALERAAAFLAGHTDQVAQHTWFLHDTLEKSEQSMALSPFRWVRSRAFGKSPSNMLVLNTHLDNSLALSRYQQASGDERHAELLRSGHSASRAVMMQRPAETLYRLLFRLIELTLLPPERAARLPLPLRVLKRLTWQHLIPKYLHRIKARYPRLVMPGGYIDRALTLRGLSHQYLPVNIWDLVRYQRRFGDGEFETVIREACAAIDRLDIMKTWAGTKHDHAIAFLVEAYYHRCAAAPAGEHRAALARAMLAAVDEGLGLPPSLLGANPEAVPLARRAPCPSPGDDRLHVAWLWNGACHEIVIVNSGQEARPLRWEETTSPAFMWTTMDGKNDTAPIVPPRGWLLGKLLTTAGTRKEG